ncbi:transposase [bacterium]|nr:transposase [bacterium]
MPRSARLDIEGSYYHLICRGQRKNPLFFSSKDRQKYFEMFNEILEEHDLAVHVYCLMTNHVHLLVRRNKIHLHNFMKRLNTRYAMYFNHKYNVAGHVFQNRYKSMIVLDESYLMHLVKYIHMNPVKAKICDEPSEYEYSSASYYESNKEENISGLRSLPVFRSTEDYLEFMAAGPDEFPTFKDSIGNEIAYINFDKRQEGREKGKYIEKRREIEKTQEKCNILFKENGYDLKVLKSMKNFGENRKTLRNAFLLLLKEGISRAGIARLMEVNRSTVGRILKSEE